MFSATASSDIVMSLLVIAGMLQLAWFSVMLVRRGIAAATLQQMITPLFTVWIVMWPVYEDSRWLWLGIVVLGLITVAASLIRTPFWQHLRVAWSPTTEGEAGRNLLPPLSGDLAALFVAAAWFQSIPEFGFGLALCFSLAFPAAYWSDRVVSARSAGASLGFPAHPQQTLAGHILITLTSTALLCWALHVYHGTAWQSLLIATLIAALVISAVRAIVPGVWNRSSALLTAGSVMWLL